MTLRIESGLVTGVPSDDGRAEAFLGIPFAAPPVGALRWRPPAPVASWDGVRACDSYGAACMQPSMPGDGIMRQFSFAEPPECGLSEDCLYLNVWRPDGASSTEPLPVIVFVYGGGHRVGSGSHPVSRGQQLARHGAVVVTVNYRVGALGYLAHPALTQEEGASGNYACLDLLAALRWVQRNIAVFGGDPARVSLFGQSAGAALTTVLMASPLAAGLFQRAIVHSGGRFEGRPPGPPPMRTLQEAEQAGTRMASQAGATTAQELRALAWDSIEAPRGFWGPIVDGCVLRESPQRVFERGDQLPVPLLAGYTSDDGAPYAVEQIRDRASLEQFAAANYGDAAALVLALYPCETDEAARQAGYALRRDAQFAFQAWTCVHLHAKAGVPAFLFNFERAVPLPADAHFHEPRPPAGYGAFHGSELWYVFGTMDDAPWQAQAVDWTLSSLMSAAWVEFARSGQPAAPGLPEWPRYAQRLQAMVFGDEVRLDTPANLPALQLFSRLR